MIIGILKFILWFELITMSFFAINLEKIFNTAIIDWSFSVFEIIQLIVMAAIAFLANSYAKKANEISKVALVKEYGDPLMMLQIVEREDTKEEICCLFEEDYNQEISLKWIFFAKNLNNYKTLKKISVKYLNILDNYEPIKSFNFKEENIIKNTKYQAAEYVMHNDRPDLGNKYDRYYRIRIGLYFKDLESKKEFDSYIFNENQKPFLLEIGFKTITVTDVEQEYRLFVFSNTFEKSKDDENSIKDTAITKWSYSKE